MKDYSKAFYENHLTLVNQTLKVLNITKMIIFISAQCSTIYIKRNIWWNPIINGTFD